MSFLSKLFAQQTNNVIIQLIRYSFVGGFAFMVDYGSLVFLTEFLKLHYILSSSISFILGLVCNYLISVIWVFDKSTFKNKYAEFIAYAAIGIVGLALTVALMYFFTDITGIHYAIAKPIVVIIVYAWNFFGRRYLIFNASK